MGKNSTIHEHLYFEGSETFYANCESMEELCEELEFEAWASQR